MSQERYRIARHRGGWFHSWRVMDRNAGVLFTGTYKQCLKVQQELTLAYEQGQYDTQEAFVQIQLLTDPQARDK